MIRHTPHGSGHPYSEDTEQRSPVLPVRGEPLRIGARASADVTVVTITVIERDAQGAQRETVHTAKSVVRSSRGQATDGGHLATAQARKANQPGGWEAHLNLDGSTVAIQYSTAAQGPDGRVTRSGPYSTDVAWWEAAADSLVEVAGPTPTRLVHGSVMALRTQTRTARVRWQMPLAHGERVVGFGERFDTLDQRGLTLDSVVFEQYKNQGAQRKTYMPMPFAHVVGANGWGFHVDTSRRVWFDVGATTTDILTVEAQTDAPADSDGAITMRQFVGSPDEVVAAFVGHVGAPKQLPDWVLRLWASGNEWNTQAEVERQMALHREHRIPVGNIVIEAWSDETSFSAFRDAEFEPHPDGSPARLSDFTFPADGAWPDPKGMVDGLRAHDVHVHLWQIPLIKMRPHPKGQARIDADVARSDRYVIQERTKDGKLRPYRNRGWWFPLSLMPDLTDDAAAQWWTDKRRYLVEEVGIDGFKTDGGEHAWGSDLVYLDGRGGDEKNNLFPVAYAKAYGDLLERCGKAPVTFSRAGFSGSQAHGAFWAGDENSTWEAFRWSMLAGLNAAASGIVYWGWDIAGFSGDLPEPELYVRAFAASAFVPIMQYHSEFNHHRKPARDRTPWHVAELSGDQSVIAEVREIVELRERLVPYLAHSAKHAVESRVPLMRPMFFDFPDDARVWDYPIQWMLGESLLVAPVLAPGETSTVYVPAGDWVDAWTGLPVEGGTVHEVQTPRSRVPVYVRAEAWSDLKAVFLP